MVTKKGIILTVGILIAITAASFLVWVIPENNKTTFVISDYQRHIDNVKEIHVVISLEIENKFQELINEDITSEDYIEVAENSSSQINDLIIQIVESDAPQEWIESYTNYMESLRKFNSQIRETIVVANMLKDHEIEDSEIKEILEKINILKRESEAFAANSDKTRP